MRVVAMRYTMFYNLNIITTITTFDLKTKGK